MEHRAFLFDLSSFSNELKHILESSLRSGDVGPLREFINNNQLSLTDPYEGEPISELWEDMISEPDAHQYGDVALTKYYSPLEDRGLGPDWEVVQELLINAYQHLIFSPILGQPIGPVDDPFDPGKMGSYFQSRNDANDSLEKLAGVESRIPADIADRYAQFKELLKNAISQNKGIYVTF